ncbi:MAG: hypothetical protein M3Y72_18130 [Acidobacteriota bacterium]|nr:hypothetical protein [Acidobacteriota bacterium]
MTKAHPAERAVTLLFNGKLSEDAMRDLDRSICAAKGSRQRIYIDLSEVTLVERKAIQYLSKQAARNVKLVNCPIYLRRWLAQGEDDAEN